MTNELSLIEKLAVSKKIMDAHNRIPTGSGSQSVNSYNTPQVENYEPVRGTYNIPQEFLQESQQIDQPYLSSIPKTPSIPQPLTSDRVMASKLPDAIKRLMIEHPIDVPNSMGGGSVLSDELVEKATRLMGTDARGNQVNQPKQRIQEQAPTQQPQFNNKQLREMLKEVVEEVLLENGLLSESTEKANEQFTFKVGKHIFSGKISKVQKTR
tara:strand:+ start:919 stop:1551 length:633 start_codon:yes stop_codon:yes gene_type:complete